MHILHVIDTLRPGGAQRSLVEIANRTLGAGAAVSVCVTRDGCDMAARLNPGIDVHVLHRARRFDWTAMQRFSRWIHARAADVIHSHGRTTLSLLAFMKALGLIRQPLVMHDHTGKARPEVAAPLWFRCWARRHVAHYVGVCAGMDAWAERAGIPAGRRSLIAGALDLRGSRLDDSDAPHPGRGALDRKARDALREFRVPPGVLLGICLGGVRPEKGIDTLLTAIAASHRRGAFRIVVVGGVRDKEYWSYCLRETGRLGLEDDVVFAGERTDVLAWLGGFDFAVHAARSESGPLVLIEHLAAGLPLVSTSTGGIAHRAGELGVERFVPPDNPSALASAIDELAGLAPEERSERGRRGQRIALRHFDIRAVMPDWISAYEKAAGKAFLIPAATQPAA